jgi:hypothetical protein
MGYSVGFIRSWLALWMIAAIVAVALGGANELFDLGLFAGGYPVLGSPTGGTFGAFALQAGIVAAVALALSLLLERLER